MFDLREAKKNHVAFYPFYLATHWGPLRVVDKKEDHKRPIAPRLVGEPLAEVLGPSTNQLGATTMSIWGPDSAHLAYAGIQFPCRRLQSERAEHVPPGRPC